MVVVKGKRHKSRAKGPALAILGGRLSPIHVFQTLLSTTGNASHRGIYFVEIYLNLRDIFSMSVISSQLLSRQISMVGMGA